MGSKQEVIKVLEHFQININQKITSCFSELVNQMNENLSQTISFSIQNAENLDYFVQTQVLLMKESLYESTSEKKLKDPITNDNSETNGSANEIVNISINPNKMNTFRDNGLAKIEISDEISLFRESYDDPNKDTKFIKINQNNAKSDLESIARDFDGKEYKCIHCSYGSSSKNNFERHVKSVHQKIKDYQCLDCDYASSRTNT